MQENLFLRFLLNTKKRVDTVAKYTLDTEVVDAVGLFATLSKIFPANVYPLPKSLLSMELPQYKELWEGMPDSLNDQEEEYFLNQYQTKIGRAISLAKFGQKKTNPNYVREIWEELSGLYSEDFLTEVEEEFSTRNIHTFVDEDKKLVTNILPSPFEGLNAYLGGGFLPQRLYAFESSHKAKKSMIFLYIGMWLANRGYRVEYISTELLPLEMRERITKMAQGMKNPLQIKKYNEISPEEVEAVFGGLEGEFSYKFLSCPSMTEVATYLKGREYDLVIIDHPSHGFMRPRFSTNGALDEWKVVKLIYKDIFRFARENKKTVIIPSWVNRSGFESLKKNFDADSHHTAGSFDVNAILDAKFLIIPRDDLDKPDTGEFTLQLKPLFLRRSGPGADKDKLMQIVFNENNCLFREVPTTAASIEKKNKAMQAARVKREYSGTRRNWDKEPRHFNKRSRDINE